MTSLNAESNFVMINGHQVNADPDSRDAVGNEEATRDPIFLLQKREVQLDVINGLSEDEFHHDGDTLIADADRFSEEEIKEAKATDNWYPKNIDHDFDAIGVDDQTLVDKGWGLVSWRTESVWFRRPEAEAWARSQKHNLGEYGKSCRVYCVCAEGRLANILKVVHCKEIEEFLHSQSFRDGYSAYRKMMDTMIGGPGA